MMNVSEILARMIGWPGNTRHDVEHLLKVWGYARTIGQLESLDDQSQRVLEIAAIVHDIACPMLRETTGSCPGKRQEEAGPALAAAFLEGTGMPQADIDRICFLVGHHHTFTDIDGPDWQILLEADYLVNAGESGYSTDNIRRFADTLCKTPSGRALFRSIYHV